MKHNPEGIAIKTLHVLIPIVSRCINTHEFVLQWFDLLSIAINCIETMENNELF